LYRDGDDWVFMDSTNYEQYQISDPVVGDSSRYLLENQTANVSVHNGSAIVVELPPNVELMITYTEPGVQGDRSTGGSKPATLETGAIIQVPLFIENDTKIKVDTRDGSYLGRVND
jgi:elongation factor P